MNTETLLRHKRILLAKLKSPNWHVKTYKNFWNHFNSRRKKRKWFCRQKGWVN